MIKRPIGWLAVSCAALLTFASLGALAGPAADFPEKAFDAGDVELGGVIHHEFVVKNTGDAELKITEVRPSCGCTIADYPTAIAPGAEGRVKLKIDTKTLHVGRQSKTVTIGTDAANAERTVLQIKLNLVSAVEFLPRNAVYMSVVQGAAKDEKILVRPHREGLKVLGASSTNGVFHVSLTPVSTGMAKIAADRPLLSERPGDFWLTINLPAGAPVGVHRAEVKLRTSDGESESNTVRVQAVVKEKAAASGS